MTMLQDLAAAFDSKRVLLIGDSILDIYVYGTAIGKSAETPTIVARELETKCWPGGAFLVARHLLALGAHVDFVTLVGEDEAATNLQAFAHPGFVGKWVCDRGRRTTIKKRYWVDGYKLLQFDTLDNRSISDELAETTLEQILPVMRASNLIVVADNRHGFLSPFLIAQLVQHAINLGKPLYVDSQLSQANANHTLYRGATVICLNQKEALAIDPSYRTDESVMSFDGLRFKLGIENIVVKLGDAGATALLKGQVWRSPALAVNAVDTCGAGDAFLAALCLAGLDRPDLALRMANIWAGLATTLHGTQPPSMDDLATLLTNSDGI